MDTSSIYNASKWAQVWFDIVNLLNSNGMINMYVEDYNTKHPHCSLKQLTPAEDRKKASMAGFESQEYVGKTKIVKIR